MVPWVWVLPSFLLPSLVVVVVVVMEILEEAMVEESLLHLEASSFCGGDMGPFLGVVLSEADLAFHEVAYLVEVQTGRDFSLEVLSLDASFYVLDDRAS